MLLLNVEVIKFSLADGTLSEELKGARERRWKVLFFVVITLTLKSKVRGYITLM